MKRLLVTGATGFVGLWTLRHWRVAHPDVELWATGNEPLRFGSLADHFAVMDLRDATAVPDFVRTCAPTHVIHLAGMVGLGSLADHMAINVVGTDNLYAALADAKLKPEPRIVQASTAAVYGPVGSEESPVKEAAPLRPLTPYALSKVTQEHLAKMYGRTHGLSIVRARIFNLLGPGQPEHLVPATFVRQLETMHGGEKIEVGNLATRRDFVDVRDVATAFESLLAHGESGTVYNVASGRSIDIRSILEKLIELTGLVNISIEQRDTRMRKNDVADVFADVAAIEEAVGWRAHISVERSLRDMLDKGCEG